MKTIMSLGEWERLPIIITQPGDYRTRDGRRVTIREISPASTFSAKGAIWVEFRGKHCPRGYAIWHPNGRYTHEAAGRNADIVGPWMNDATAVGEAA